jgi:hypothetical protein
MVRRRPPMVEGLEGRALLSALQYTLTSDQSVYPVGQTINLTFTETNTSDQSVTVDVSPVDFTVSQSGAPVWQSNAANSNQPPTSETLIPGQSVTQTASWTGTGTETSSGVGLQHPLPVNLFGTFTVSNPNAPSGLNATFQITDPMADSLTTDQSDYTLGQPIQLTYTELNTSNKRVFVDAGTPAGFEIMHNGTTVFTSSLAPLSSDSPVALGPGQTLTATQTWNGIPSAGPYTYANLTGTFDVAYGPSSSPAQSTATFQITPPSAGALTATVATDQLVYTTGQPVGMTFTETNNGAQPLAVLTGPTEFEVTQNGTSVWNQSAAGVTQPTWMTLQHGQTYTQSATWDDSGALTGSFAVSNAFDPTGSSATFQIVSASNPVGPNHGSGQPPAPIQARLSTGKQSFKLGKQVHLSLFLKNVSASNVAIKPRVTTETVIVEMGSTVVYKSSRKVRVPAPGTIKPGHSIKLTSVWSGKGNQTGIKKLSAGTYTITAADNGYSAATTIQLAPRHE